MTTPQPAPGSDAAIKAGCTCPAPENNYGAGMGRAFDSAGRELGRTHYIARGCPVHDPRPDAETGGRE